MLAQSPKEGSLGVFSLMAWESKSSLKLNLCSNSCVVKDGTVITNPFYILHDNSSEFYF